MCSLKCGTERVKGYYSIFFLLILNGYMMIHCSVSMFLWVFFVCFFTRNVIFVTYCVHLCISSSFEKESTLKGKNLLPLGANSFLLE